MCKTKKFARGRQFGKMIYLKYKWKKKSIDKKLILFRRPRSKYSIPRNFFFRCVPKLRRLWCSCRVISWNTVKFRQRFRLPNTKFRQFVNFVVRENEILSFRQFRRFAIFLLSNLCFAVKVHISPAYETKGIISVFNMPCIPSKGKR